MKYSEVLDLMSESIFDLENKKGEGFRELVTNDSLENIRIYNKNLIGGVIRSFSTDFPITLKYLGENNFKFFILNFLKKNKIETHNIFELSKLFPGFISESYEIHQDDLVEYLAKIDLFWSHGENGDTEMNLPMGIAEYWGRLGEGLDSDDITINLDRLEKIRIIDEEDERKLVIENYD